MASVMRLVGGDWAVVVQRVFGSADCDCDWGVGSADARRRNVWRRRRRRSVDVSVFIVDQGDVRLFMSIWGCALLGFGGIDIVDMPDTLNVWDIAGLIRIT